MANPFDYKAPWAPAPVRTSARTYAQWAISALGAGIDWIGERLQQLYLLGAGQAGVIANNAALFQDRLDSLNSGPQSGKVRRGNIPRNRGLPDAYRAVATACFRRPGSSASSSDPADVKYITYVADFDHNPTLGEIIAAGPPIFDLLSSRGSPRAVESVGFDACGVTVQALERRT